MCLRAVNSSPGRTPTCISLLRTTILTELQNFSKCEFMNMKNVLGSPSDLQTWNEKDLLMSVVM